MEAFLRGLLPRLLPEGRTFEIHAFQGKPDLLGKIEKRLLGYRSWLPDDWRVLVVVDRDEEECMALKQRLEQAAANAGLITRTKAGATSWQVVNRIAIEELESWYFGDWEAVRAAYPRVNATVPARQAFRDPDAIAGGTWEAFERVMQQHGYFKSGLRKIELARELAATMEPGRNRSASFRCFYSALLETGE